MHKRAPLIHPAFFAFVGLLLLSVLVYFYAAFSFSSVFAKTTLGIPGIHFPVFVGEVFLACAVLLAGLCQVRGFWKPSWRVYAVAVFVGWIAAKALTGFKTGGAFSFRNAALFYYPFTALLVYYFVWCLKKNSDRLNFFSTATAARQLLVFCVGAALAVPAYSLDIFPFAQYCICLALPIFVWYVRHPILKVILAVMSVFALIKSGVFACTSRSHLLGVVGGLLFLAAYFWIMFDSAVLKKWKMAFIAGLVVVIGLIAVFSDKNALKSLSSPSRVVDQFKYFDEVIKERLPAFEADNLPVCTYADPSVPNAGTEPRHVCIQDGKETTVTARERKFNSAALPQTDKEFLKEETKSGWRGQRTLGTAYVNILFRAFIWRDMIKEFWDAKPWMGFSFGKAQRSRSIEVLGWAESAWQQDGWIAPHNSFLHIIYRGGMVGLLLIVAIGAMCVWMTRVFLRRRSVCGGLLMSAIVFGLVSANFLLFLEVPYTAIPFWYVFGMTAAYARWLTQKS